MIFIGKRGLTVLRWTPTPYSNLSKEETAYGRAPFFVAFLKLNMKYDSEVFLYVLGEDRAYCQTFNFWIKMVQNS